MKRNSIFFFLLYILQSTSSAQNLDESIHDLIIIGSGPAGLTAALFAAQMGITPLVITGKELGGQLTYAPHITNWPGETSITGKELVSRLYQQAKKAGARFLTEEVLTTRCQKQPFSIETTSKKLLCRSIIIATGSKPKLLNVPGEKEYWGNGISTCALCDGMLYKQKNVAIIGNGNMALHNALHMLNIANHIYIITKKSQLSGTKTIQQIIHNHQKCTVLLNCTITEFQGNQQKGITELSFFNIAKKKEESISIDGIFLSIGSIPNIDLFVHQLQMDLSEQFPYVSEMVKTSAPGIFIAMPKKYNQAIIAAGLGCAAALSAHNYLEQQKLRNTTKKTDQQ